MRRAGEAIMPRNLDTRSPPWEEVAAIRRIHGWNFRRWTGRVSAAQAGLAQDRPV